MPDLPRDYDAKPGGEKPTAFVRLSHAIAELRAAFGYIGIPHAQVMVGIVEDGDNRGRLVAALPIASRPSVNRQRSEVVELDGISIQMFRARTPEHQLCVEYLRHLATLRPADAHGLRVAASDIEANFHRDPELNPAAAAHA